MHVIHTGENLNTFYFFVFFNDGVGEWGGGYIKASRSVCTTFSAIKISLTLCLSVSVSLFVCLSVCLSVSLTKVSSEKILTMLSLIKYTLMLIQTRRYRLGIQCFLKSLTNMLLRKRGELNTPSDLDG